MSIKYFVFKRKDYSFEMLILSKVHPQQIGTNVVLLSDKQPKIKVLILSFCSYIKYLNIRLSTLFEHTDNISIKIVLVKDVLQTQKSDYFLEPDFKRNRLSEIL